MNNVNDNVNVNDNNKFDLLLRRIADGDKKSFPRIFRYIINLSADEVGKLLTALIANEVEKRGGKLADNAAVAKAASWLTTPAKVMLMLSGGCGTGKTTLMKAMARLISQMPVGRQTAEDGIHVIGMPYEAGTTDIRFVTAAALTDISSDDEAFKALRQCDFLFIDDIGIEPQYVKNYGTEIQPLADVLYYRYDFNKFTVMTTNLNRTELNNRYGVRMASRFCECLNWITIVGKDLRL